MLVRLVLVFLLLSLCLGLAGYVYYDTQRDRIKKDIQHELSAVTDLKVLQINAWRRERLGDANSIAQSGFAAARVEQFMNDPAPKLKEKMLAWMRSIQDVNNYASILLIDGTGRLVLVTEEKEQAVEPEDKEAVLEAHRNRQARLSDIHRSATVDYAHIDLVAPLVVRRGKTETPVGALLMRIDPEQFLYPLVQTWPTPSKSAETLLLRREGNEAVILNEARHRKNTALTFRVPLGAKPALAHLLDRGQAGIVEVTDYRGVPVLAAVQPMAGEPWFLVSKIDQEEIYAPLRERSLLLLIVFALLIAAAGVSTVFWWRQKSAEHLRQQSESELQRRTLSQKYLNLSQYANDIILLIDSAGNITEANNRAMMAYGYMHEELVRLNIRDLQPAETHSEIPAQMQRVRDQKGFLFETVHLRKDGASFPVEINSRIIDVEGKSYFLSVIRDITERNQANDALRHSEMKYRELTELLPQTVFETDEKGNLTFSNKHGFDAFGYSQEEIDRGLNVLHMLIPEDRERARTNIQRVLNGEKIGSNEYTVKRGDGVTIPVLIYSAAVIRNSRPVGLRGIVMDIAGLKKVERALHESERRYKRIIESVTDYIYTVEVDNGRPVSTCHGPGCVTVTGYTAEEYQADPSLWLRMIHEDNRSLAVEHAEKILAGVPVPSFEHRLIHKNGSLRWVRNTLVPRYDAEGRLIAYDGLITDITQIKLLENQLRQAQKMEAVGQLAGGVAHDFNNILTAIIGYAHLLLMKMPETDTGRPYAEHILSSSERAAHLTQSLLAFSRKQLIDLKPGNVNDIIRRVAKLLVRVIGEDIEFKTRFCDTAASVLADSIQIEQVLMNLATNARDAMPDGGTLLIETDLFELGEEFIRTHAYGKPGPYVLISVTDSGSGMEEKVRNRIFEPFYTTKEVGKGTGLGLSMVYGIIKQHDGYINVTSEPGQGTTFKIYLPIVASAAMARDAQGGGEIPRGTETVLLAEDDAVVRDLTGRVLEDFGYKVIEAVDGEDAIRVFREKGNSVDLLVLDIIMPRKNGKEAYQEIKKMRPGIKALFTSGYTADIVHKKGILETGLDFIVKPSTPSEFLQKVREVLDKPDSE